MADVVKYGDSVFLRLVDNVTGDLLQLDGYYLNYDVSRSLVNLVTRDVAKAWIIWSNIVGKENKENIPVNFVVDDFCLMTAETGPDGQAKFLVPPEANQTAFIDTPDTTYVWYALGIRGTPITYASPDVSPGTVFGLITPDKLSLGCSRSDVGRPVPPYAIPQATASEGAGVVFGWRFEAASVSPRGPGPSLIPRPSPSPSPRRPTSS